MTDEMALRVAKAMFEHDALMDERRFAEWDDEWKSNEQFYLSLAHAAIKAMLPVVCPECGSVLRDAEPEPSSPGGA